nr:hypothetical protein [Candidatus Sigynarchaeota archaeon]
MNKQSRRETIAEKNLRIAIDSNTYRNLGFINFLQKYKDHIHVHLPSIVYLEVGYYFMSKGISWDGFVGQLQKMNGSGLPWDLVDQRTVLEQAIGQKGDLPFKAHFRDFLIGVQCMKANLQLITNNKRHFQWCSGISVVSPEEFVTSFVRDDAGS